MNPVLDLAARSVSMGWLLGVMTVFFLLAYLGWVWWAFDPRHKIMLEEAALLPFLDDAENGDET
jgi:cbb3-type cytochrome oxidase subunit 3